MSNFDAQLMDLVVSTRMGEESLCFFEARDLSKPSNESIESLDGLVVTDDEWSGGRGLSAAWEVRFTYGGYRFVVDSNSHAGLSYFYVDDPKCPKGILIEVLDHFNSMELLDEDECVSAHAWSWTDELKDIGCAIVLVAAVIALCWWLLKTGKI